MLRVEGISSQLLSGKPTVFLQVAECECLARGRFLISDGSQFHLYDLARMKHHGDLGNVQAESRSNRASHADETFFADVEPLRTLTLDNYRLPVKSDLRFHGVASFELCPSDDLSISKADIVVNKKVTEINKKVTFIF